MIILNDKVSIDTFTSYAEFIIHLLDKTIARYHFHSTMLLLHHLGNCCALFFLVFTFLKTRYTAQEIVYARLFGIIDSFTFYLYVLLFQSLQHLSYFNEVQSNDRNFLLLLVRLSNSLVMSQLVGLTQAQGTFSHGIKARFVLVWPHALLSMLQAVWVCVREWIQIPRWLKNSLVVSLHKLIT